MTRVEQKGQALGAAITGGSPLRAYQDFAVGSRSVLALLRYEIAAAWGAVLPGAFGLLYRRLFWGGLFASSGRGVVWGRDVILRHPGKMAIGRGVIVDDGCYLDAKGCAEGEFRIDEQALVGRQCVLSTKGGGIVIGARANLGAGCMLFSSGGIAIGADTMLAAQCYVGGGGYEVHGRLDVPMRDQPVRGKGVTIEEDCWLGAQAVVIDGVRIGRGSVVAAGAVVTKDVPEGSVVAGVPARVVGMRGADLVTTDAETT